MVVLSAAIATKNGKTLIARQFVEMTRIRIEGLLAAFPKLLGSDAKQHTYVETESVRYLYQPMDNLYLLLVTNRASNIVEDLETLRLLSKVVPDVAGVANNISEEKITEKCFELIFAFDEVITTGGYREPITLQQIRTNMEMESHEENLQKMIKQSKMESAKDQARDAARTIRDRQREHRYSGSGSGMTGIGGGSFDATSGSSSGFDTSPRVDYSSSSAASSVSSRTSAPATKAPVIKGMSLAPPGGKNKSLEDALVKEDKLAPVLATTSKTSGGGSSVAAALPPQPLIQHPVMLQVAERVSAKMTREGMVESFEIKGSLTLTASNDEAALCSVQLAVGPSDAFTFNTHPKVNKAAYDASRLLQLKDATKGFPSARPVGILRWTYSSNSDEMIPIKINCWPEEESRGQMNVSIEYNLEYKMDLYDVCIRIPLGTSEAPGILSVDGSHKHNPSTGELIWEIDLIDSSNSSGSLEFNIAQRNSDAFFPISVTFSSHQLYCNVDVTAVQNPDGSNIQYGLTKGLGSEEYLIV